MMLMIIVMTREMISRNQCHFGNNNNDDDDQNDDNHHNDDNRDNRDDHHNCDDQNNGVNPAKLTHQPKDLQPAGDQ